MHGPRRHAHAFRDLPAAVPLHRVEEEHPALAVRQRGDRALEIDGLRVSRLRRDRLIFDRRPLPLLPAPAAARAVERRVDRDRVDPRPEGALTAEVGQRPPDPDEDLLQELLGTVRVALPARGEGPDAAVMVPIDGLEGRQVTPPGAAARLS